MVKVTIKASAFVTKPLYFELKKEDQVLLSTPTYNKSLVAEGYCNILNAKLEVSEQDLVFYQSEPDSPIYLEELAIKTPSFRATFVDLLFKSHDDKRIEKALKNALKAKHSKS